MIFTPPVQPVSCFVTLQSTVSYESRLQGAHTLNPVQPTGMLGICFRARGMTEARITAVL